MMPFTMMPVGPIGDSDAKFAPFATMAAIGCYIVFGLLWG
jgi:hypothetical protein